MANQSTMKTLSVTEPLLSAGNTSGSFIDAPASDAPQDAMDTKSTSSNTQPVIFTDNMPTTSGALAGEGGFSTAEKVIKEEDPDDTFTSSATRSGIPAIALAHSMISSAAMTLEAHSSHTGVSTNVPTSKESKHQNKKQPPAKTPRIKIIGQYAPKTSIVTMTSPKPPAKTPRIKIIGEYAPKTTIVTMTRPKSPTEGWIVHPEPNMNPGSGKRKAPETEADSDEPEPRAKKHRVRKPFTKPGTVDARVKRTDRG